MLVYVKINFARHQHDTDRSQNGAGFKVNVVAGDSCVSEFIRPHHDYFVT